MTIDLLKQQEELQVEAAQVIERLDLVKYYSHFGTVEIGGSVATGLMTWRDIDAGVLVQELPRREKLVEFAKYFLKIPEVVGVNISDNTLKRNLHHPTGLYVGLTYLFEMKYKWKIDTWLITPDDYPDTAFTSWLTKSLTPEHKLTILQIKNAIHANPKYKKTVFSVDIYKAVIEENVSDLDSFKQYLSKTNREL